MKYIASILLFSYTYNIVHFEYQYRANSKNLICLIIILSYGKYDKLLESIAGY